MTNTPIAADLPGPVPPTSLVGQVLVWTSGGWALTDAAPGSGGGGGTSKQTTISFGTTAIRSAGIVVTDAAGIQIMRTATVALSGTATLVITSTNLPGSLAWSVGNAMAAGGAQRDLDIMLSGNPLKSSVPNTATTIVMPAPGAGVLWRAVAYNYLGT